MANNNNRKTSIASKFNQSLISLFLVVSLILVPIIYFLTRAQVMSQADSELTLLVDIIKSVRNVVREDTRPHFIQKAEFFPPVVSSTVMAKTVAEKFARIRPEYYIKIFSDNPLNAEDLPDELEKTLLTRFRQDKSLKTIVETGTIRGKEYLVSSAPSTAKEGCLRCHGEPDSSPPEIASQYGSSGYGWRVGDIVGGIALGVPLADVTAITLERSIYALLTLATIFGLLFLYINSIVRKSIIVPIAKIATEAKKIAKGDASQAVQYEGDDELGELANSFELMRRTFISLVRKIKE